MEVLSELQRSMTRRNTKSELTEKSAHALKPFQIEGVHRSLCLLEKSETKAVYNASQQRLGKTIMSIECINELAPSLSPAPTTLTPHIPSILIVCPATVQLNWKRELQTWLHSIAAESIHPVLKGKDIKEQGAYHIVIISWDLAKKKENTALLCRRHWDFLILDEVQKANNRKSQRAKSILGPIWDKATYRFALSGTPFTSCVADAYTIFNKMLPTKFKNYYEFADRYCYKQETPFGTKYHGVRNHEELRDTIRANFFVRYLRKDVIEQLPALTYNEVLLPSSYALKVPKEERLRFEEAVRSLNLSLEKDKTLPAVPESLAGQRKEQGTMKAPAVISFVRDLLEQDIPVILFAWHTNVIASYVEALKEFNPSLITGSTPNGARDNEVRRFQDGDTNLFIGNIVAAGLGINLSRSSTVVYGELSFVPSDIAQATDRAFHMDKKDPIDVYYFTATGSSLDETVLKIVASKAESFSKVLS